VLRETKSVADAAIERRRELRLTTLIILHAAGLHFALSVLNLEKHD
jgi:hypothetical protein